MTTVVQRDASSELAGVEADLTRRFDIVAGSQDGSDFVVLLGLLNAGRVASADRAPVRRDVCEGDPFLAVERHGVGADAFAEFQRLWYRLRVPFGEAPLYWWYLLTAALREPGRTVAEAAQTFTAWLEQFGQIDVHERAAIVRGALGTERREVVVAAGDLFDTDLLVEAIVRDVPLLVVASDTEVAELCDGGWTVVEHATTAAPAHTAPGRAELAGGRLPDLADITARTRAAWAALAPDERTLVLTALQQRLDALEQMRFTCGGDVRENRAVVEVIGSCRGAPPADWSCEQLTFATLALCWEKAGFILQEFNQSLLTLPLIATFLARRLTEYAAITGLHADAGSSADLVSAAVELGRRRVELERTHQRCIQFDGSNWERREFIVRKALRDDHLEVPLTLADLLATRFGVELADRSGSGPAWDEYLQAILEAGHTPTQLLCAVVDWAANDDQLPMDAAIFTVPHGIKLDAPWELEIDEVFCYTAFRDGFDPADHGMRVDLTTMRNAIGQRMRYNVVKKAQNYALVKRFKPQSFNLPDIAVAEDANHAGHRAGGIRLSMRLPTWISYRGNEWKGIADVRFNRAGYHPDNHFRPSDVVVGSRLTVWEKGIADATFARDLLFDRRYCVKLTGPTGAQMPA